jgi:thymidylate synthase
LNSLIFGSLGAAWIGCLKAITTGGQLCYDGDDQLLELRNFSMTITSVDENDAALRKYADQDRIALMHEKYSSLGVVAGYPISYGALLYDNHGVDQVEWVVARLQANRDTKAATIALHSPGEDELSCLSLLDFKIRADQLHMLAVYRSQNAYASQPGNLLALRRVQRQVAAKVGAAAGEVTLVAASAHVYLADLPAARSVVAGAAEITVVPGR